MNMNFLGQPWMLDAGWALIHSVWECTLVAILTATIAGWTQGRLSASRKYGLFCAALALTVLLPLATYIGLLAGHHESIDGSAAAARVIPAQSGDVALSTTAPPSFRRVSEVLNSLAPCIFALWVCGAAFSLLRLVRSWRLVRRLKTWTTEAPPEWQARFRTLASRLGMVPAVQLRGSPGIVIPCVIGWLKPVVLVPAAAFSGLHPARLEAILTHELAHVQRNDYPVSVLQGLAEALYFYHPAVWWVSEQMRDAREQCCDDVAVQACGSVSTYVLALADLEESRQSALALAATDGDLTGRVRRLLGAAEPARITSPVAGLLSALVILAGVASLTVAQTPPMPAGEKPSEARATAPSRDELLVRNFDESQTLQAKREAISRLSGGTGPVAWAKLVAIAEQDADRKVREEAISYLAGRANETAVRELIRLYDRDADTAIRLHLLSYLSGLTASEAAKGKVRAIAMNEQDPEIRAKATDYMLGR